MAELPIMRGAERPHVSASFIVDYFNCAYLAKRKRVNDTAAGEERIPFVKYARQAVGSAAHTTIEEALIRKARSNSIAPLKVLHSIFHERFALEMEDARIEAQELEEFGTDAKVREKLRDQGITIVDFFHAEVLPTRAAIDAEVEVRIPLSGDYDLYGKIDEVDRLEDGAVGIRDQKIVGKNRAKDPDTDLRQQVALTIYAGGAALKYGDGVLPSKISVDNYRRGETDPERILDTREAVVRQPQHIERVIALADECARGWMADYFPPTGLGKWICAAQWCPIFPCKWVLGVDSQ